MGALERGRNMIASKLRKGCAARVAAVSVP